MALKSNPPLLVAIDTNVALDFADGRDDVVDSLFTIRKRIKDGALCVPPTAVLELGHAADFGETSDKRAAARKFLQQHRAWKFRLFHFVPAAARRRSIASPNPFTTRGCYPRKRSTMR